MDGALQLWYISGRGRCVNPKQAGWVKGMNNKHLLCSSTPQETGGCGTKHSGNSPSGSTRKPQRTKTGDRILVEVICERVHCVIYDYAISTVKLVADEYKGRIQVRPVVRRGSKTNVERYLELCRINGGHLSVPTILIEGKVVFTDVPEPADLRKALDSVWAKRQLHP